MPFCPPFIYPEANLTSGSVFGGQVKSLRAEVEKIAIEHKGNDYQVVTISCGVASYFPGKKSDIGWENVIKDADDALYRAKEGKRNTVYSV